jgi:hypothetical protein
MRWKRRRVTHEILVGLKAIVALRIKQRRIERGLKGINRLQELQVIS